jgi:hypothetical protein
MAQLLFDMGLEQEEQFTQAPPSQPRPIAKLPPMPQYDPPTLPAKAKQVSIPIRLTEAPPITTTAAAAATTVNPHYNTAIDYEVNRLSIIDDLALDREEAFAQVYLYPSPYHEAFEEEIDLRTWTPNDHHTAGLVLIQLDNELILGDILKSTPAARIDKWRSRCRGATLLEVKGIPVQTSKDVHNILVNLKQRKFKKF